MNKIDTLAEIQNLNTNARKALAAKVLSAQAERLQNSYIPLEKDHSEYVREARTDRAMKVVAIGAIGAAVVCATGYVVAKVNEKIEEQAKKEKQKLQEERKEMIQKLSRIKGRA